MNDREMTPLTVFLLAKAIDVLQMNVYCSGKRYFASQMCCGEETSTVFAPEILH
jgi:hypothetical protein